MAARCAKTCAAKGGCSTLLLRECLSLAKEYTKEDTVLATTLKLDRVRNLTKTTNMAARCAKTCAEVVGGPTMVELPTPI